MVKLFFAGVAVIIFVVIASFTAIFSPLLSGISSNLGGSPSVPFHSPVPQSWVDWVAQTLGLATPSIWLTAVLGVAALLLVYTLGNLIRFVILRAKARRRLWADLRWRARVAAARHRNASSSGTPTDSEPKPVWE